MKLCSRFFSYHLFCFHRRWLVALFVLERFIIDVLKPLFHQPHACEEMHAFDAQACGAASTNTTCTAVPQANPAMKTMGKNIPRCIWLGGACEPVSTSVIANVRATGFS